MNLNTRKSEIEVRIKAIQTECETAELEALETLESELDGLIKERTTIDKKLQMAGKFIPTTLVVETKNEIKPGELEERGVALKEGRVVKIAQDEILLPNHVNTTLAPYPFAQVSNLADQVSLVKFKGGETYQKSFVKAQTEMAGYTKEGEDYKEVEPEFGYVTITKCKLTAYTEITEEVEKLPAIEYDAEVIKNIKLSLKRKISHELLRGNGSASNFTGLFSKEAVALADCDDLKISEINENTLDDIIFAYGADEDVETGGASLILNKNDLRSFAGLRTKDGRKLHSIDYVKQTIDGIPYIINSNCYALTNPKTKEGSYCMAYGALKNYEIAIFSPIDIAKSTDYKFRQGIIGFKASVFMGGNVIGYQGFVRIAKGAASAGSKKDEPKYDEDGNPIT
ncbi:MAG: phage major capsid protein [Erysipelotrichales bacterium]|nr:phage major capsid protein [Erysipelotrichales bacterium]